MNNSLLDILAGRERKRYHQIIQLIEQKKYNELFESDIDNNFGLSNQKYINRILTRLEQEVFNNIDFLIQMNQKYYHRADYFNEKIIKSNPNIVEQFINNDILGINRLILMALDNGYNPSDDYINNHIKFFSNALIMQKLIDNGYRPTNEMMESNIFMDIFSNEKLLLKALDWGYVPSLNFIIRTKALENPNLIDRILDTIELTSQVINSEIFYGNVKAQQKIIDEKPYLLLSINSSSSSFESFWIEAFKKGYMPEKILTDYSITSNYVLFSKVIKQKPEMVKYCKIIEKSERERIDELALCMGYVPSIDDAKNSEYVRKSLKLMQL